MARKMWSFPHIRLAHLIILPSWRSTQLTNHHHHPKPLDAWLFYPVGKPPSNHLTPACSIQLANHPQTTWHLPVLLSWRTTLKPLDTCLFYPVDEPPLTTRHLTVLPSWRTTTTPNRLTFDCSTQLANHPQTTWHLPVLPSWRTTLKPLDTCLFYPVDEPPHNHLTPAVLSSWRTTQKPLDIWLFYVVDEPLQTYLAVSFYPVDEPQPNQTSSQWRKNQYCDCSHQEEEGEMDRRRETNEHPGSYEH